MKPSSTPAADLPPFRARLTPSRSLSPTGFLILMSAIGSVSAAVGIAFISMGAWPVAGFFGLDVLLVYYAFRANYRDGRAFETIEITSTAMTLTRVDKRGQAQSFDFNPYWARVALAEEASGHTKIHIVSHGRAFRFGAFLSDDDRREFAAVLATELDTRRHHLPHSAQT